jgi:hypothetical protein
MDHVGSDKKYYVNQKNEQGQDCPIVRAKRRMRDVTFGLATCHRDISKEDILDAGRRQCDNIPVPRKKSISP